MKVKVKINEGQWIAFITIIIIIIVLHKCVN